jgi:hypothetical protein
VRALVKEWLADRRGVPPSDRCKTKARIRGETSPLFPTRRSFEPRRDDREDAKIKGPKFKDGKLTFSAEREFMDNTITVDYTLTIDGDKFKGKSAAEFGGEKHEWDIEGKREKKDK